MTNMTNIVHIKAPAGSDNQLYQEAVMMLGCHESDLRQLQGWQQEFEHRYTAHQKYVSSSFWRILWQRFYNWYHQNDFYSTPEYDCQFESARIHYDSQTRRLTTKIHWLETITNSLQAGKDVFIRIETLNHLLERNVTKWKS